MSNNNSHEDSSGVDEGALNQLMLRIGKDMKAQEAALSRDPSSGEKAAGLLIVLREAQRRLNVLANSYKARKEISHD